MHDESPIPVSEQLSHHIEEALRIRHTRKRYAAFRSALADVLGLPRADLGIIAVRNVSQTLHRRLEDGPSSPVTVLILKTQDASKVKKEVLKAKDRIYQALNIGNPPRRTAIIYAREEDGKTPTWTVKAVVEAVAKGARRLTADSVGQYYPQAERTLVLADRGRADLELEAKVRASVISREPYTLEEAASDLFMTVESFARIRDTLMRKKNVVLEGPPGVGKTFLARRLADAIVGQRDAPSATMVQFHPSYAYEDFVRGWRPGTSGHLELQNGLFLEFCRSARQVENQPWILIVDEINRGNLAKIFGELLMLIEADKRAPKYAMPLAYSDQYHDKFWIPPNVYLLGLMNTADRSLAMVDYALRRRFAFIQLTPAFENPRFVDHLRRRGAPPKLITRIQTEMTELNERIQSSPQLGSGFVIGHSYFVPPEGDQALDEAWYTSIVDTEIVPLLHEYWADNPSQLDQSLEVLGKDSSR